MTSILLIFASLVSINGDLDEIRGRMLVRKGAYFQELLKKLNRDADRTFSERIEAIGMPCELRDETIAERSKIAQKLSAKFSLYPIDLEMNSFGLLAECTVVQVLKPTQHGDNKIPAALEAAIVPITFEAIQVDEGEVVATGLFGGKAVTLLIVGIDTKNIVDGSKFSVPRICVVDGTHKIGSKKIFRVTQMTQKEHDKIVGYCEQHIDEFLSSDEAKEIGKILSEIASPR